MFCVVVNVQLRRVEFFNFTKGKDVRLLFMYSSDDSNDATSDAPSQFMIQSSQQVWSAAELSNLSESSLAGGL